jgi:Fe-Mn family superoxide dismutase
MQNLHWDRPARRFAAAQGLMAPQQSTPQASDPLRPEELRDLLVAGKAPLLLDVCLGEDIPQRHDKLPNAKFVQAEKLSQWMESLAPQQPIVTYCMYGYQVSGNAVLQLRDRGFEVRSLAGGIAGWRAIGGPTEALES